MIVSKITKYVMYLEDHEDPCPNEEWGWKGAGWYFEDEIGDLLGPYATEELTLAAFDDYIEHLTGGVM